MICIGKQRCFLVVSVQPDIGIVSVVSVQPNVGMLTVVSVLHNIIQIIFVRVPNMRNWYPNIEGGPTFLDKAPHQGRLACAGQQPCHLLWPDGVVNGSESHAAPLIQ